MEMAQLDDWLDGINTHIAAQIDSAGNVPRLVVVLAVRSAVKEFLEESNVWVYRPKDVLTQLSDRIVMIPRDTYICKVWPMECNPCVSNELSYSHPNIIHLADVRNYEKQTLEGIEVSLSITQSSLECPMFVFDRYHNGILSGTLARLQAMPGKAWSDPSMVAYHLGIFETAIKSARSDVENSFNKKRSNYHIPASFT